MQYKTKQMLNAPYLIFIGDTCDAAYAKTGIGIVQWCPTLVAGQLRFAGNPLDLGVPDLTLKEAAAAGVKSLLIGVAPAGGQVSSHWCDVLVEAAQAGLDVISGLHQSLEDIPVLVQAAKQASVRLIDVRKPPLDLPVATGIKRAGKRLLMVGTDCAVGKKYSALALSRAFLSRGIPATFRATGQTGIMIAGAGIPIDAVVSDFVAGAAEQISPENQHGHWDVIEGQGSLFHPAYAGVSLGLLHGSQADAIVLCHDPRRSHLIGWPDYPLPDLVDCIERNLAMGALTNENICCVGVCINTAGLSNDARNRVMAAIRQKTNLPCVDPLVEGVDLIVDELLHC